MREAGGEPQDVARMTIYVTSLPEYRKAGLAALVIRECIEGVRRAGYHRLEASLIDGRNSKMRHIVESAGMEIYKRYRVYERPVSAG